MKARPNWASAAEGLRKAPDRKLPKIVPTPMAAGAHADGGEAGTDILGRVDIAGGEFTGSRGIH